MGIKKVPSRVLSKSKFSMFLRTKCDKELYLSLFKNSEECRSADIPIPLKTRPGVQLVTKSGREFELEQYDQLINSLPGHVVHERRGNGTVDPLSALEQVTKVTFILQPEISPENFRNEFLDNIGLSAGEKECIPKLSGLKPDVLFVHERLPGEFEILPDGSRVLVDQNDKRKAISIIDLKNVVEGNPSYCAEVCLYALFFANWLYTEGVALKEKYFVSERVYLWKHNEMPLFTQILSLSDGGDLQKRIEALIEDLNEGLIDYLIYMPSVKNFFKKDIPRVVTKGDHMGWREIEYHVNPRCGSCDWLGNVDWLHGDDLAYYLEHKEHYCIHTAGITDHLSKLANISTGAAQILTKQGYNTISSIVDIPPLAPVLRKHAFLKRDKAHIGKKAAAITSGVYSVDGQSKIAGLARKINAEYDIIVNFDAGSGLLTGVAFRGILFPPYGMALRQPDNSTKTFHSFGEKGFVVPKDHDQAEWVALQSFIETLAQCALLSDKLFFENSFGPVHTQICFWEPRQYEELCNAFSRHLLKVLELPEKSQRALAWLFPAEELIEREEHLSPGIVFIRDIVDIALRLPVKFANTLVGVSEVYHPDNMKPRHIDRYYKEPLGNAIPRERIFEIWKSSTNTVKMYGKDVSIFDAIKKYEDVLKAHTYALAAITAKLRSDLSYALQGTAPTLTLSELNGTPNIAYDSKLWVQWERVNSATAETQAKANLLASVDRLEASYKAIILNRLIQDCGNHVYEFEVNEESTESKLEEGKGYYVLGIVSEPGFPLFTPIKMGLTPKSPADYGRLCYPLYQIIAVDLLKFDRANRRASISVRPKWSGVATVFNELFSSGLIQIDDQPIYIMEGIPPSYANETLTILRAIGNPQHSTVAKEALYAMGKTRQKKLIPGTDQSTPISRVLWEADRLSKTTTRSDSSATAIALFAMTANDYHLNDSQKQAVFNSAKYQLSIIWGPPGTGKTDTLTALLHAIVHESISLERGRKILITGPNYRAVEELASRLLTNLNKDPNSKIDLFWVYSSSRSPRKMPDVNPQLTAHSFSLNPFSNETQLFISSLINENRISIVATSVHVVGKIVEHLSGKGTYPIKPIFDNVVIDESSQVEVTRALAPLAVLKEFGQIVIAGDHLQMQPISSLLPPRKAEYLVGSIQNYLLKRFQITTQNLLVNYRSNQDLVDYAKTIGYPKDLRAKSKIKQVKILNDLDSVIATLPNGMPITQAYKELLVPNRSVTALIHEDTVSSQANEVEAKIVAGLAYCIRHSMATELDVNDDSQQFSGFSDDVFFKFGMGVVTPHKAQKALVIKELRSLFPHAKPDLIYEAVDTVERFQGGERQTIIVSFGVGDVDIIQGEEAFLFSLERTNVAVSRAQAKCILLMPSSLAYHLPMDEEAAKTSRAVKSYIEEFCKNKVYAAIEVDGQIRFAEARWH